MAPAACKAASDITFAKHSSRPAMRPSIVRLRVGVGGRQSAGRFVKKTWRRLTHSAAPMFNRCAIHFKVNVVSCRKDAEKIHQPSLRCNPAKTRHFRKDFYHGLHGFHGWKTHHFLSAPSVKSVVPLLRFCSDCQENILDINRFDNRFSQCLQGFRSFKKPLPGSCADLAPSAKMER
jgi:hypothetical protein